VRAKRHPALAQLSRDHHHALVVAQRLQRASDDTAGEVRAALGEYWSTKGREHFREEEEVLLPAFARFADPRQPLVAQVLTDHVQIRCLVGQIGEDEASPALLHRLGSELERHVRREERELFPLIEQAMSDDALRELAASLRA
jgi:hemerythrin-like domain-containing protein